MRVRPMTIVVALIIAALSTSASAAYYRYYRTYYHRSYSTYYHGPSYSYEYYPVRRYARSAYRHERLRQDRRYAHTSQYQYQSRRYQRYAVPTYSGSGRTVTASWYDEGTRRADGRRYDPEDPRVCAHKTLPFGTRLLLTYEGRHLVCEVRDRGPYIRGRSLDLSRAGARILGIIHRGVAQLRMFIVS